MKTKEEILQRYCENGHGTFLSGGVIDGSSDDVYPAMDEYAKQEAISFLKWKENLRLVKEQRSSNWLINYAMGEMSLFAENDEQLYELYLQSKQQTK